MRIAIPGFKLLLLLLSTVFIANCKNTKVEYKKGSQKNLAYMFHFNKDTIKLHNQKSTVLFGKLFARGVSGNAWSLNGADEYVMLLKRMCFPQQTISVWVKPIVTPDMKTAKAGIFSLQSQPDSRAEWRFQMNRKYNRLAEFVIYDPKQRNAEVRLLSKTRMEDGVWTHVAVTIDVFDKNVVSFYVNGVLQAEKSIYSNSPISNHKFHLGVSKDAGFFKGYLDELVIFSKTMTEEEIKSLANNKTNPYFALKLDPSFPKVRTKWISLKKKKQKKSNKDKSPKVKKRTIEVK